MKKLICFLLMLSMFIPITGCSSTKQVEISDGVTVEYVDALYMNNGIRAILKATNNTKEIQDISNIAKNYFTNSYLTVNDLEVESEMLSSVSGFSSETNKLAPDKSCYIKLAWNVVKPDSSSTVGLRNRETKDEIIFNKVRTLKDNTATKENILYDCEDFSIEIKFDKLTSTEEYEYGSKYLYIQGPKIIYTNKTDSDIYIPKVSISGTADAVIKNTHLDKNESLNPYDWDITQSTNIEPLREFANEDRKLFIVPANKSETIYLTFPFPESNSLINAENPSLIFEATSDLKINENLSY